MSYARIRRLAEKIEDGYVVTRRTRTRWVPEELVDDASALASLVLASLSTRRDEPFPADVREAVTRLRAATGHRLRLTRSITQGDYRRPRWSVYSHDARCVLVKAVGDDEFIDAANDAASLAEALRRPRRARRAKR